MNEPASATVVVRGLERRLGAIRALRGVDLAVDAGQSAVVFGANGAGKTTLLRVLAGLLRPSLGSVHVLGRPVPGDAALRRRIGLVAHESMLYGDLTGRENLDYYAALYGIDNRRRTSSLLEELGLGEAAARPVRTYSRGMQQRLSLARALLHEPALLLLDEPFTGLDPAGAERLTSVLARVRAAGTTLVLATHDVDRGLALADRVFLLDRGRVAWSSTGKIPDAARLQRIWAEATRSS